MVVAATQRVTSKSPLEMRWCVLGANGQIGRVAARRLTESGLVAGDDLLALSRSELDITDHASLRKVLIEFGPDVVLNAAAYTDVDGAETSREAATLVNELAPAFIAELCLQREINFVHISTDYVFDGAGTRPYTEADDAEPLSHYGHSKLQGEKAVLAMNPTAWVIRTSWIYAPGSRNFPTAILARLKKGEGVVVVDDQVGTPTSAVDFFNGVYELVTKSAPSGTYHLTNQGQATWYEFAREIAQSAGFDPKMVTPGSSATLDRAAQRPRYSVLSTQKWVASGLGSLTGWQQGWQSQVQAFIDIQDS
jgi:dTDP-4-dehydrorhamnose reductase